MHGRENELAKINSRSDRFTLSFTQSQAFTEAYVKLIVVRYYKDNFQRIIRTFLEFKFGPVSVVAALEALENKLLMALLTYTMIGNTLNIIFFFNNMKTILHPLEPNIKIWYYLMTFFLEKQFCFNCNNINTI